MNNKINMAELMKQLSKMDKKDIENGIQQLSSILNTNDKNKIMKNLQNRKD